MAKLLIKAKQLEEALRQIESVVKPVNVTLTTKDNTVVVGAESNGRTLSFAMNAEKTEGIVKFTVVLSVIKGIVKGRSSILFTQDSKNVVKYKNGNYSGEFCCIPYEKINAEAIENAVQISKEQQEAIISAFNISISSIYDINPAMVGIKINKEGCHVVFFDLHHISCRFLKSVSSKKPIEFTLPIDTFTTINSLAGKQSFSFEMTDAVFRASNELFNFSTPLVQSEESSPATLENSLGLLGKLESQASAIGDTKEICKALGNANGVYEQGAKLMLVGEKEKLVVSLTSSIGKMNLSLESKVKGNFNIQIDPYLLEDLLKGIKQSSITLNVHKDRVVWGQIKDKEVEDTFMALLA